MFLGSVHNTRESGFVDTLNRDRGGWGVLGHGRVGTQDSERRMRMRHLVWAYAVCGSSNPQIATLPHFSYAGVVLLDFKSEL